MVFILGTRYLYLGVLRFIYGVRYAVSVLISHPRLIRIRFTKLIGLKVHVFVETEKGFAVCFNWAGATCNGGDAWAKRQRVFWCP